MASDPIAAPVTVRPPTAPAPRSRRRTDGRVKAKKLSFGTAALLPFILFGVVLAAYPAVQVARFAVSVVQIRAGAIETTWSGFENFTRVFSDPAAVQAMTNTLVFVILTVVISLVLGLALAFLVDRSVIMLPIARNMMIWPAVIAPVIVSLMWLLLLSPTAGGLNKLLGTLGLPEQGWIAQPTAAMAAVIAVDVWHWTPVAFIFFYTALRGLDASTLEAARIDGASEWQIGRFVILPLLAPTIAAVVVVRTIMGVKAFDEMYLLTRGGPNGATTLVTQHIKTLFYDNLQLGQASAFSLTIVFIVAVVLIIALAARSRTEKAR